MSHHEADPRVAIVRSETGNGGLATLKSELEGHTKMEQQYCLGRHRAMTKP